MPIRARDDDETRPPAGGYGADVMATCPALTPKQKAEFEALAEEEEAAEREAGVDQIPTNVAIRRYKEMTMDYASDAMAKTLRDLDEQINGKRQIEKALDDVRDDVGDLRDKMQAHHEQDARRAGSHEAQLADMRELVRDMRARNMSSADVKAMLSRFWDDMKSCLDEEREARRPESDVESANKSLMYAAASFLDTTSTRADATRVVSWLVKSFGRRGGKVVAYNREVAGRLLLSKSISPQEHENWKRYDRLPDDVTLQSAGRAQEQADRAMLNAYALASMNLSPLAVQHLLMRRR
jgi:hypothetical protein